MSLSRLGDFKGFAKFLSFSALTGFTTYYLMNPRVKRAVNRRNLIIATGCDSGLGFSIAIHCHDVLNMSVVACINNPNSKGTLKLKDQFGSSDRFHVIELEVRKKESVDAMAKFVKELLEKNKELELTALINNCGVMCFGETEWQTDEMIDSQIDVNLSGTIRVTKAFLPLIRRYKSRIVNVTSHCSLRSLPGAAVYCASKAGLAAFTDSLRLDMNKYGVEVVNFIPGQFVMCSNIMSRQAKQAEQMRNSFSEEQLNFYGEYFDRYMTYLQIMSGEKDPKMIDTRIIETFENALLDDPPKARYICEPLRYTLYHTLFKITPQRITDYLLHKFVAMPQYNPSKPITNL